jgi:hypothetical protein
VSEVAIDDTPVRVHLPSSIVVQALRIAQALRLLLLESTMHAAPTTSQARDQVRQLLRACTLVVTLHLFFNKGGSDIDCLTENLVASKTDGIRMYYRTRKGQGGVLTERELMCNLPPNVHIEVLHVLLFFDSF